MSENCRGGDFFWLTLYLHHSIINQRALIISMKWTAILLGYTRCRSDITRLAAFQTVNNAALSRVGKTCQNKHSRRPQSLSAAMTVVSCPELAEVLDKKDGSFETIWFGQKLNPEQRRISAVVEKYCYYWVHLVKWNYRYIITIIIINDIYIAQVCKSLRNCEIVPQMHWMYRAGKSNKFGMRLR